MTTKKNPFDPAAMSDAMKSQAQQIWLAGLGAFSKAQQDGAKAFEKLVSDGISMQRKAQSSAEEKLAEATQHASAVAKHLNEGARGQIDRLEVLFEERVAKAMHRMGMPSLKDFQDLTTRVAALEKAQSGVKPARDTARKPASKKAPTVKSNRSPKK
jgi:poly(hydroxyalkanoate) granule-associated protein